LYSNLSTAFMRPMLPSWMRSRNCRPRFVYFLAMETTRRRLASTSSALALGLAAGRHEALVELAQLRRAHVGLLLDLTDALDGQLHAGLDLVQLGGVEAEATTELELLLLGEADVLEELAQLLEVHAGAALTLDEVAFGPGDALDQHAELADDAVDGLAPELHVLDGLEDRLAVLVEGLEVDLAGGVVEGGGRVGREVGGRGVGGRGDPRDKWGDAVGAEDLAVGDEDALELVDFLLVATDLLDLLVQHVEDPHVALLDALGDLDLALAGEQRDGAHLAQVHAHGVVGPSSCRRQ
jgi:hypothetical protein